MSLPLLGVVSWNRSHILHLRAVIVITPGVAYEPRLACLAGTPLNEAFATHLSLSFARIIVSNLSSSVTLSVTQ
jgi:hypothetical protein